MFRDKAYVCNLCRKVITYSIEEAGTSRSCPFCRSPLTLPADTKYHPEPKAKKSRLVPCLLLCAALASAAGIAAIAWLALTPGATVPPPFSALPSVFHTASTVAPEPAHVRGVRATVAVTEVRYGCADIYHPALRQASRTETPVCCIKLAICNAGKVPVPFRSWREPSSPEESDRACLTDREGRRFSRVSYGAGAYPVCATQATELACASTLTEQVFFFCGKKPDCDLELVLPGENLGGRGDIRFHIPAAMIQ